MAVYKKCSREECGRRVYAVRLCSEHYAERLFGPELDTDTMLALRKEEEEMCSNPLCGNPVRQKRDDLGNVIPGKRKEYCKRCERQARNHMPLPGLDEWEPQECAICYTMADGLYVRNHQGRCKKCVKQGKKESNNG